HLLSGPHHGYVEETIQSLIPPTRTFWSFRAKSSSSNMVLTRSRSGESREEQTQQELSVTAGPGANTPAPESSSVRVTDTGSGSTATTNIDATLKPSDTRSRRSTCSKKKRLAELEAIEQLEMADMDVQLQQAQARRRLKEIQLQRLRIEAESSDDEELEDDLASVRIGTWLAQPAPPPGGETRPPPHDASGGRISRDAAHAATATYTGAPAGAHPLRDDDGYNKVCECVCSQTKGNIASEVSQGNVSDRLIDVGTLAAALAQVMRSSREPPKYMQRLPVFDGKPVPVTLSGPHSSLDTYALLDDGSTVTLLDATVADILGIDGPASSMWIQGIGTEVKHEQSRTKAILARRMHSLRVVTELSKAPTCGQIASVGADSFDETDTSRPTTNARPNCTKKKVSKDPTWKSINKSKPVKKDTQTTSNNKTTNNYITLPASYIKRAEEQWIKGAQAESFSKEIAAMRDNKATPGDGPLSVLSTYLDSAGVLRLRGRITAVQDVNEEIKNPVILEGQHRFLPLRGPIQTSSVKSCGSLEQTFTP
ncbi:hypothetical protein SFRURICE_016049, partial [Spodoptera frugiperda]